MSAADNFEENTKSDSFYVPSYSIGCFHQIFRKCFNFICSYISYTYCLISVSAILCPLHCVKSVQIRSFFWSVFSSIWTEYGDIRSISPYSFRNAGKCGTEKIPYLDIFHTMLSITFLRNGTYLKPHGDWKLLVLDSAERLYFCMYFEVFCMIINACIWLFLYCVLQTYSSVNRIFKKSICIQYFFCSLSLFRLHIIFWLLRRTELYHNRNISIYTLLWQGMVNYELVYSI